MTVRSAFMAHLCVLLPTLAAAQRLPPRPASAVAVSRSIVASTPGPDDAGSQNSDRPSGLRPLRVAKWSLLAGAASAGIYGFIQNDLADDRFRELEQLCEDDPVRCAGRTPDGEYVDAELEAMFDEVRRLDGRSYIALLAGQIGVATSAALFLLDLGNSDSPDDIPWTPGDLRLVPVGGRVELSVHLPVRAP